MAAGDIILGDGTFYINGTAVGLTRGGGQFVVERENKIIEADGDFGPVKGRIRKIGAVPKLTMNNLELTPARLQKMYPATTLTGDKLEGAANISTSDYCEAKWVGQTADGRDVIIIVKNAINMENIDLSLADKEEIVASVTFTGTYEESDRTKEPWSIEWVV